MHHVGICPSCGSGLLGIRQCRNHPLVVCDECDAVWLSPDTTVRPTFPAQPDLPCPHCGNPIWTGTRWATHDEVLRTGWQKSVQGEIEKSGQPAPPLSVFDASAGSGPVVSTRVLRWGILGTARIAAKVAQAIQETPDSTLMAVASRDVQRAHAAAEKLGAATDYHGYERLLDDPEIDAVYIPLPPSLHAEWTIRAAQAGKHVLCEKPLATSAPQAREMIHACRQHAVQLMDGVQWLHHPRTVQMRAMIDSGQLGPLRRVVSAFSFRFEDFLPDEFRFRPEMGGGALLDLGWYCLGATLWATQKFPTRVFASAQYRTGVDLGLQGMLWFDDPSLTASFDCGFDAAIRKWFEVSGTQGSLVCDDFTRPWNVDKTRFWMHGDHGKSSEHRAPPANQAACMIAAFADAVRSGQLNHDWLALSLAVQTLCDALAKSARTGQVVDVAPV